MKLLPFNDFDLKTPKILEALNEASRSLAELKGFANSIPNQHILINAITINEAKDSSEIENIVTTHDSIYKVLTESGYKDESAKEVVDYRSAIWRGYEIIKEKGFISTNVLVELQRMIEHNKAGVRKNPGTKLVNSKTGEVIYTPPQEEKEIRDLLKNLEDYINENDDEVDPLIKMALIHYQFETIHPFYDGNGRTGRILNVLYLVLNNLLDSPILYLSNYINKNKDIIGNVRIDARGFATPNEAKQVTRKMINKTADIYRGLIQSTKLAIPSLEKQVANQLAQFIYGYLDRKPLIIVSIKQVVK